MLTPTRDLERETGRQQWEHPLESQPPIELPQQEQQPAQHAGGSSKRRQYAVDQNAAYAQPAAYPDPAYPQPGVQPAAGSYDQTFTPGEQGFYPEQQQQQQYPAQQPAYGVGQLTDQFSGLGVAGQKPMALHTVNLLATRPEPAELAVPPEIRLPPGVSLAYSHYTCAEWTVSPQVSLLNAPTENADASYMRCTVNAIPKTAALLNKTKLPLALIMTPNRSLSSTETPIPVVSDTVIARCRRCRAYINAYVQFVDGGSRWRCCICGLTNDVPQLFDWDSQNNTQGDRWARPELSHGVVDFVAPTEYMVRAPMPLTYVFLLDVSHAAVQSGMLAAACRTLLENLERIPNEENRTKIAIIGFDVALHFFPLKVR